MDQKSIDAMLRVIKWMGDKKAQEKIAKKIGKNVRRVLIAMTRKGKQNARHEIK